MERLLRVLIFLSGVLVMPNIVVYLSSQTISTLAAERESKVEFYSTKYGLSTNLVKAIISNESFNYKFSYRDDSLVLKKQKWVKEWVSKNPKLYKEYGDTLFHSAGYMQVLFIVAVADYYFRGTIEQFLQIDNQLDIGCRHLKSKVKQYRGNLKDAISAYNQGWNGWKDLDGDKIKDENEVYYNQPYVDKVWSEYVRLGGQ